MSALATRVQALSSVVLAACSIALVALLLRPEQPSGEPDPLEGVERPAWEEMRNGSRVLGAPTSENTVVVFTDYECEFCRTYDVVLKEAASQLGDSLRIVVRFFPLRAIHPTSPQLAVAAACGAKAGRFPEVHAAIVRRLEKGQAYDWQALASAAGVPDQQAFIQCVESEATGAEIAEDIRLANQMGIRMLPAVILNGARMAFAPSAPTIVARVREGYGLQ